MKQQLSSLLYVRKVIENRLQRLKEGADSDSVGELTFHHSLIEFHILRCSQCFVTCIVPLILYNCLISSFPIHNHISFLCKPYSKGCHHNHASLFMDSFSSVCCHFSKPLKLHSSLLQPLFFCLFPLYSCCLCILPFMWSLHVPLCFPIGYVTLFLVLAVLLLFILSVIKALQFSLSVLLSLMTIPI